MGLIEQAAKRLEELRRAGVEVPVDPGTLPAVPVVNSRPSPAEPPAVRARAARLDLDLARLASRGLITPDQPRSHIANEFRVIKRPLLANAIEQGAARTHRGNLIMVTSAVPGEGKTFTALNLAMSIAMELERTVLLVDADVARPSLPRTLGIPETPGLLDVLNGRSAAIESYLHATNVGKLAFLSSGTPHSRATEVLASSAMSDLLEHLAGSDPDRIIVFDSPPLLATTEARELASHMGQIIVVVSAGETQVVDVKRALATIEACPLKMVVLNKASKAGHGVYGYGYGYGA